MYFFLILSILVTPKENLDILTSVNSSSASRFSSAPRFLNQQHHSLTIVFYTFPFILAGTLLSHLTLLHPIPTCLHTRLHLFSTQFVTLDQGCPTLVLEGFWPAYLRCFPASAHKCCVYIFVNILYIFLYVHIVCTHPYVCLS